MDLIVESMNIATKPGIMGPDVDFHAFNIGFEPRKTPYGDNHASEE
jgi:hypothetical protein